MGQHAPVQSVQLEDVDIVELLERLLDLSLVGLDVDDKDKGVVLLHLLHGALRVKGMDDDLVGVQAGLVGDRLARVLGGARDHEGLWAMEGGSQADLALLLAVGLEGREGIHVSWRQGAAVE